MIRIYGSKSHSCTHLTLGIVREPRVRGIIASQYPVIHEIDLPIFSLRAENKMVGKIMPAYTVVYLCQTKDYLVPKTG